MVSRMRAALVMVLALLAIPASARADVVLQWSEVAEKVLPPANPFVYSRVAAATHLAMFEAVNAITRGHRPYNGAPAAPAGASAEAAAVEAAYRVLVHFVPAAAATLEAARTESLAAIPDGAAKTDGIAVGAAAASAMVALRANDGASPAKIYTPASGDPGEWQLTPASLPPGPGGGVALQWGNVTPFGLRSGSQFRAPRPPSLTSERYRRAFDEVRRVGAEDTTARPADRADVAVFYNGLFPGPLWNRVARQLAAIDGRSLSAHARAFALLNMAMADGLISVLESKYQYVLWRPETAIRGGNSDGNRKTEADLDFKPFIVTPCHPSYPSGHASASNAASGIVVALWGNRHHSIVLDNAPTSPLVLHYTKISDITRDIDDARIYGGVHFRFDQDAGSEMGRDVAKYIHKHYLRPRR